MAADHSGSSPSEGMSEGEGQGEQLSGPSAHLSNVQRPELTLQDSQLDNIVQRVVAKLQAFGSVSSAKPAQAGKKALRKGLKRSACPLSSSSESECPKESDPPRSSSRGLKVPRTHKYRGGARSKPRSGHRAHSSLDPWVSSIPTSSGSSSEEGELSGSDADVSEMVKTRFFPLNIFQG